MPFLVLDDAPFSTGDFIDKLFPNFWSFLINILALIVLFVALYFIAYKPVKKFVKARKDYVEGNLREAEEGKKEAERIHREKDAIILEAREEGKKIIDEARSNAEVRSEEILADAALEASRIKKEAEEDIALSRKKAEGEIRTAILEAASETAKKAVGSSLTPELEKKIREEARKELSGNEGE